MRDDDPITTERPAPTPQVAPVRKRRNICQRCTYFELNEDTGKSGLCHRHAPKPALEPGAGFWPTVLVEDWCGEFA